MKEVRFFTTLGLSLIVILYSCSIEKRHHLKGYHIEWRKLFNQNQTVQNYKQKSAEEDSKQVSSEEFDSLNFNEYVTASVDISEWQVNSKPSIIQDVNIGKYYNVLDAHRKTIQTKSKKLRNNGSKEEDKAKKAKETKNGLIFFTLAILSAIALLFVPTEALGILLLLLMFILIVVAAIFFTHTTSKKKKTEDEDILKDENAKDKPLRGCGTVLLIICFLALIFAALMAYALSHLTIDMG